MVRECGSEDSGHLALCHLVTLLLLRVGGAVRQLIEASLPGPPQAVHQQGGGSEHGHTTHHRDQDHREGGGAAARPWREERGRGIRDSEQI